MDYVRRRLRECETPEDALQIGKFVGFAKPTPTSRHVIADHSSLCDPIGVTTSLQLPPNPAMYIANCCLREDAPYQTIR